MALQLKVAGHTYAEIADALGLRSRSSAQDAVERESARHTSDVNVESYRVQQMERLEGLWKALWPLAIGDKTHSPNMDAVDRLTRIAALQARLLGMYREPSLDFEAAIRKAAVQAGEDPDEAVKEALAVLRGYEGHKGRGGLTLVSGG